MRKSKLIDRENAALSLGEGVQRWGGLALESPYVTRDVTV